MERQSDCLIPWRWGALPRDPGPSMCNCRGHPRPLGRLWLCGSVRSGNSRFEEQQLVL